MYELGVYVPARPGLATSAEQLRMGQQRSVIFKDEQITLQAFCAATEHTRGDLVLTATLTGASGTREVVVHRTGRSGESSTAASVLSSSSSSDTPLASSSRPSKPPSDSTTHFAALGDLTELGHLLITPLASDGPHVTLTVTLLAPVPSPPPPSPLPAAYTFDSAKTLFDYISKDLALSNPAATDTPVAPPTQVLATRDVHFTVQPPLRISLRTVTYPLRSIETNALALLVDVEAASPEYTARISDVSLELVPEDPQNSSLSVLDAASIRITPLRTLVPLKLGQYDLESLVYIAELVQSGLPHAPAHARRIAVRVGLVCEGGAIEGAHPTVHDSEGRAPVSAGGVGQGERDKVAKATPPPIVTSPFITSWSATADFSFLYASGASHTSERGIGWKKQHTAAYGSLSTRYGLYNSISGLEAVEIPPEPSPTAHNTPTPQLIVSVELIPLRKSANREELHVSLNDVFLIQVFVINCSESVKRLTVGVPENTSKEATIVALDNSIRIGPLAPHSSAKVGMRFLALQKGSHLIPGLDLRDLIQDTTTRLERPLYVTVQ